jgi:hypothetical protein
MSAFVTKATVEALTGETVAAVATLSRRIAALEARLAQAEERAEKSVRFRGTYQRSDEYWRGDCVNHQGQLWFANKNTMAAPGSSLDWQLMQKAVNK